MQRNYSYKKPLWELGFPFLSIVIILLLYNLTDWGRHLQFVQLVEIFGFVLTLRIFFQLYKFSKFVNLKWGGIILIVFLYVCLNFICTTIVINFYGFVDLNGQYVKSIYASLYIAISNFINRGVEYRVDGHLRWHLLIQSVFGYLFTIYVAVALFDIVRSKIATETKED